MLNTLGFYTRQSTRENQLILGPFHGMVACVTIDFGRGVCGAAAASKQTVVVPDVDAFPGHIACDSASKSEIVVPIVHRNRLEAVIDLDCGVLNGFDEKDRLGLQRIADLLASTCDWKL